MAGLSFSYGEWTIYALVMQDSDTARRLRREMTASERFLWEALRGRRTGAKFRRQAPIGRYIADFACHEAALVVEIDGAHHDAHQDALRDGWFEAQGWLVVRYGNPDVLWHLEAVVTSIRTHLAARRRGHPPA